jgi:hypothetical protein
VASVFLGNIDFSSKGGGYAEAGASEENRLHFNHEEKRK